MWFRFQFPKFKKRTHLLVYWNYGKKLAQFSCHFCHNSNNLSRRSHILSHDKINIIEKYTSEVIFCSRYVDRKRIEEKLDGSSVSYSWELKLKLWRIRAAFWTGTFTLHKDWLVSLYTYRYANQLAEWPRLRRCKSINVKYAFTNQKEKKVHSKTRIVLLTFLWHWNEHTWQLE